MVSLQMLLSTAAPLGLSGGDIAARHGKTPPVAAQAVEGRTGNPSRGSMVPALVGSMGRADNSPPKNPDREGTQAHILSLEAELQVRQLLSTCHPFPGRSQLAVWEMLTLGMSMSVYQ